MMCCDAQEQKIGVFYEVVRLAVPERLTAAHLVDVLRCVDDRDHIGERAVYAPPIVP
jgi:hypothetical protein